MNELKIFKSAEFGSIRTTMIDGEPWFVGKDVAEALGYGSGKAPTNAVANHVDPEDKGVTEMMTPGGRQNITIINESGVYALVFGSKLESAKRFKRWVTSEVLSTIRKTVEKLESIEYCGEIEGLVYAKNGVPMTTSAMISKKFKKNHKDILRMIDNKIESSDENVAQFCAAHIRETQYIAEDGQVHRQYELDKQGFSFIALSMTGVQADVFKIQYINAFTRMEEKIAEMYKARVLESVLPQNNSSRQFVYIIKNPLNDTVKIGVAQDVQKRLQQLQTGAGVELELLYQSVVCSNAYSIESDVHSYFADYRTFGEWYKVSVDEAIDYLERQRFVLRSEYAKYVSILPKFGMDDVG